MLSVVRTQHHEEPTHLMLSLPWSLRELVEPLGLYYACISSRLRRVRHRS